MSKITNLIGTTWRLDGLQIANVPQGYGVFSVSMVGVGSITYPNFSNTFDVDAISISCGYSTDDTPESGVCYLTLSEPVDGADFAPIAGEDYFNWVYELTITGGTDISNPLFIDFINTYGTLVSGGAIRKFTKLIPENQCSGGTEPDRDFVYVGAHIHSDVNGIAEAFPAIKLYSRQVGSTGTPFDVLSPTSMGDYKYFETVTKGYEIRFGFNPSTTQASSFRYFRSEKLGFNITSVVANQYNYTDWIELNEDVFDIEGHAYVAHNSGGS